MMHAESLKSLHLALKNKTISAVELTQHYLQRIRTHRRFNAFISIDETGAILAAQAADKAIKRGEMGHLTGIPMAHKDIFCTTTLPTTCGSKMLANFQSPYAATMVNHLDKAGAIVLGKTNMDEFGMGSNNENSYFGSVKNPWNIDYVAGGSSGGSAAAVAADLVFFATGSDTGGSIRLPAAFCGISGLKPTYGCISRYGQIAYASSLDQAGPMARSAEDLAYILEVMAGFDPADSTSVDRPIPHYAAELNTNCKSLKIGLPSCFFDAHLDSDLLQAIENALAIYEAAGATLVDLDFQLQSSWVPCYYVLACAEASSNLSRYDGIRFGHRSQQADSLRTLITHSRDEGFGLEVKRRILTGTHVLSTGYYDAYYLQAQKIRRMIQAEFLKAFETVDVIIGPTSPICAKPLDQKNPDPTLDYLQDIFTVPVNLSGLPALSIPMGFKNQLPLGMQLIGPHFSESTLLSVAHYFQQQTDWHLARPPML